MVFLAGPIGIELGGGVRADPVALALIGLGVAWLVAENTGLLDRLMPERPRRARRTSEIPAGGHQSNDPRRFVCRANLQGRRQRGHASIDERGGAAHRASRRVHLDSPADLTERAKQAGEPSEQKPRDRAAGGSAPSGSRPGRRWRCGCQPAGASGDCDPGAGRYLGQGRGTWPPRGKSASSSLARPRPAPRTKARRARPGIEGIVRLSPSSVFEGKWGGNGGPFRRAGISFWPDWHLRSCRRGRHERKCRAIRSRSTPVCVSSRGLPPYRRTCQPKPRHWRAPGSVLPTSMLSFCSHGSTSTSITPKRKRNTRRCWRSATKLTRTRLGRWSARRIRQPPVTTRWSTSTMRNAPIASSTPT